MGWWRETINIVKENDPAARTSLEVLLTYPGVKALAAHRVSHFLWNHGFKLLARMHSQFWRFWTQIEIHPGATIASGVFIDHGAGLVIGETAIVEKGVMLYHGVTLGGTGKDVGKRHPTVREGALVSAHAQVIGPVEIGAKAKVGAGAVVVSDVPSDVTVVGVPAKIVRVHGRKDEPVIHQEEEKREYYMNKLEHANEQLQLSNNIKEEYVGRFMNLCSVYINRLDTYRRMVNKKISAGQMEELLKMVRSREVLDTGLKELSMITLILPSCTFSPILSINSMTCCSPKNASCSVKASC